MRVAQVSTFGISPPKIREHLQQMQRAPPQAAKLAGSAEGDDGMHLEAALAQWAASGTTVLGAVDYLDRLKGVAPKLLAWEALLRDYPRYRTGFVLVQVCVGARNRIQIQTAPLVEGELRRVVERINAAFPGAVHFEVRAQMLASERLRLWQASHVFVATALRESINVNPLEFVLARHLGQRPPGVLVLTEFTGFARVLNGCLAVNPNSLTEIVETLDAALSMPPEEAAARAAKDLHHIQKCTLDAFARRFVEELKSTATKRACARTQPRAPLPTRKPPHGAGVRARGALFTQPHNTADRAPRRRGEELRPTATRARLRHAPPRPTLTLL